MTEAIFPGDTVTAKKSPFTPPPLEHRRGIVVEASPESGWCRVLCLDGLLRWYSLMDVRRVKTKGEDGTLARGELER